MNVGSTEGMEPPEHQASQPGPEREPETGPRAGIGPLGSAVPGVVPAALSLPARAVVAVAAAVVAVAVAVHLAMVFLHVAPSNTLTKKHGRGGRRLRLSGVRAELEALRSQPAPAEHRRARPRTRRQGRRQHRDHGLGQPLRHGRRGHPTTTSPPATRSRTNSAGLGLLQRLARRQGQGRRAARRAVAELHQANRDAPLRPRTQRRLGRAHPGPLGHHAGAAAELE